MTESILSKVDEEFAASLRQLMDAAQGEGFELVPASGMRDPWTQARLWRQSRGRDEVEAKIAKLRRDGAPYLAEILEEVGPQRTGSWRTNSIPGLSWHQLGKAVDFG